MEVRVGAGSFRAARSGSSPIQKMPANELSHSCPGSAERERPSRPFLDREEVVVGQAVFPGKTDHPFRLDGEQSLSAGAQPEQSRDSPGSRDGQHLDREARRGPESGARDGCRSSKTTPPGSRTRPAVGHPESWPAPSAPARLRERRGPAGSPGSGESPLAAHPQVSGIVEQQSGNLFGKETVPPMVDGGIRLHPAARGRWWCRPRADLPRRNKRRHFVSRPAGRPRGTPAAAPGGDQRTSPR